MYHFYKKYMIYIPVRWFNVGQSSATLAQHRATYGDLRVRWVVRPNDGLGQVMCGWWIVLAGHVTKKHPQSHADKKIHVHMTSSLFNRAYYGKHCERRDKKYTPSKHETLTHCWFNVGPAS